MNVNNLGFTRVIIAERLSNQYIKIYILDQLASLPSLLILLGVLLFELLIVFLIQWLYECHCLSLIRPEWAAQRHLADGFLITGNGNKHVYVWRTGGGVIKNGGCVAADIGAVGDIKTPQNGLD